jgi:iron complex transport system ATP-binding protein
VDAVLSCDNLCFGYGRGPAVLNGVSLSLAPGRVCALVGPNGSGKSTLLRVLAGLAAPRGGSVTLAGRGVRAWSAGERAGRLALVPQRPEVAFGYTVAEVVRFGLVARGGGVDAAGAVRRSLDRVGLSGRASDRFEHLSVGQQQRAALARAVAQLDGEQGNGGEPGGSVLLADEPVSAMDPRHAIESLSLLRSLAGGGHAVLVVLHDLNHALRFSDDAVVLGEGGRVAASGAAGSVLTPGVLEPVFGVGFESVTGPGTGAGLLIPTEPAG